jgi:hypothetical protein
MLMSRIVDYELVIYDNRSLRDLSRRKTRRCNGCGNGIEGSPR